jgi:hypothetical protein
VANIQYRPTSTNTAHENNMHNLYFIIDDKNRIFSFLSSIFLDLFYDGIQKGCQQKPTGVLLSRGIS